MTSRMRRTFPSECEQKISLLVVPLSNPNGQAVVSGHSGHLVQAQLQSGFPVRQVNIGKNRAHSIRKKQNPI